MGWPFRCEGHFYVCRAVDLLKLAKVNAYIVYIFGKIEDFKEAKYMYTYIPDTGNMVEI